MDLTVCKGKGCGLNNPFPGTDYTFSQAPQTGGCTNALCDRALVMRHANNIILVVVWTGARNFRTHQYLYTPLMYGAHDNSNLKGVPSRLCSMQYVHSLLAKKIACTIIA